MRTGKKRQLKYLSDHFPWAWFWKRWNGNKKDGKTLTVLALCGWEQHKCFKSIKLPTKKKNETFTDQASMSYYCCCVACLQPRLSSSSTPLSLRSGKAFSVLIISCTSFKPSSCWKIQLNHLTFVYSDLLLACSSVHGPAYQRSCPSCLSCKVVSVGPATSFWCRRTVSFQSREGGSNSWDQMGSLTDRTTRSVLFCDHKIDPEPWPVGDDGLHYWSGGDGRQVPVLVCVIIAGVLNEFALLFVTLSILLFALRRRRLAYAIYLVAIVTCGHADQVAAIDFFFFLSHFPHWQLVHRESIITRWRCWVCSPIVISKLIILSPIFLSIMVASRKEPKRKNSSIFPVALWWRGVRRGWLPLIQELTTL